MRKKVKLMEKVVNERGSAQNETEESKSEEGLGGGEV